MRIHLPIAVKTLLTIALVPMMILSGCAKASTDTPRRCTHTITTGIVGASTQKSDTDSSFSPNAGVPILVFRADDPGLALPIPPELEALAERMRADAQVGPPGRPDNHRIAPPPEQLGPPTASTETDAAGCFEAELPPGDYLLGHPESVGYVAFTVATGKRTGCGHSTGYRFSRWSCGAPE